MDCLFCKIIKKEVPSTIIFENDLVLGFKDINPIAKTHNIFIHKSHSRDVFNLIDTNPKSVIDIFEAINEFAKENNFSSKDGIKIINNCGKKAGQTVFHTHFHFISES